MKMRMTKDKLELAQGVFGATAGIATGSALEAAGATSLGTAITGASASAIGTAASTLGGIPLVGGALSTGLTSTATACASAGATVGTAIGSVTSAVVGAAASIGPVGWGLIAVGGLVWWLCSDD